MKKTIRSLLVSLPLIIAAAPSFAGFELRIPMEVAGGGSMPNGSITFGNKAETPPETVEPEVVDPFAPANPVCDPLAQEAPMNNTGKELVWSDGFRMEGSNGANGLNYRSCKLKDTGEPNLLARFVTGISYPYTISTTLVNNDKCDPSASSSQVDKVSCRVSTPFIAFDYKPTALGGGSYAYTTMPVTLYMPDNSGFSYDDIGSFIIDGKSCENMRKVQVGYPGHYYDQPYRICDYSVSYESLKAKKGKPFLVEIYRK